MPSTCPPTSQVTHAAGKFLIVAPNTEGARTALARCRQELDSWCLEHTFGEIGVGLAATTASCRDFTSERFRALNDRLFAALDVAKHQRFSLCEGAPATLDGFLDRFDNTWNVCAINGRHPADPAASSRRGYALSRLANDQIDIGEALTRRSRLLVLRNGRDLPPGLGLDYFGYRLAFVAGEEASGRYGQLAHAGTLLRAWDFGGADADGGLWRGYGRRFVNAWVPRFDAVDEQLSDKYGRWEEEADFDRQHPIKTLHHIACEDRRLEADGRWKGEIALVTVKGDIDNLGKLFQQGLEKPSFARLAALSRQVHAFFSLWLPWFCEHGRDRAGIARYRNTYTVFAGGDDFFLIGPWESTLALAGEMRRHFAAYMANDGISFSAGLAMVRPKTPLRQLARSADQALAAAKARPGKNAAALWNMPIPWEAWEDLLGERLPRLEALMARAGREGAGFSTGLVYALLQLSDMADSRRPEDALWRSRLHYRLARFFRDRVKGGDDSEARRKKLFADAIAEIGGALGRYRGTYRLPLSVLLYRQRD